MTNNEIVIALRAVAEKYKGKFVATFETNISEMATDAANHIERLCEEINRQKAEIERLKNLERNVYETVEKLKNKIESEARKAFAERLHKAIDSFREKQEMVMLPYTEAALCYVEKNIDNLVKEMEKET